MKIHIVMHESYEAPAAIAEWAARRGHTTTYSRLYAGDTLPASLDSELLVVMGGPQSPATTKAQSPHFDAEAEKLFIRQAIDQGKLVLGVCLGAQLIGEALGAPFEHSPNREIGVFDLTMTEEGRTDRITRSFPTTFPCGHWHGDMPGLTKDAVVLATSAGCPRQIVRYTDRVYGFQCHFEFTRPAIEQLIEASRDELEQYEDLPYVETPDQLRSHDYSSMNSLLFDFLDSLTAS